MGGSGFDYQWSTSGVPVSTSGVRGSRGGKSDGGRNDMRGLRFFTRKKKQSGRGMQKSDRTRMERNDRSSWPPLRPMLVPHETSVVVLLC